VASAATAPCTAITFPVTIDRPGQAAPTEPPAVTTDTSFDCMAWQVFITLNWPSLPGQQGVPDPAKQLGDSGTPVWQTFAAVDRVFLPNGARPALAARAAAPVGEPAEGLSPGRPRPRLLTQRSKVSPTALQTPRLAATPAAGLMPRTAPGASGAPIPLDPGETEQADGNVLIDQNGQYAYYEEVLNPVEVGYILNNNLYEAGAQNAFAQTQAIVLPPGSIEIKAAWKILGANDDPTHFLTAQAFVDGGTRPVTVGLIGMHIMMRLGTLGEGVWATFQQIENAPSGTAQSGTAAPPQHYSFYNTGCDRCTVNAVTAPPTPTQVRQVFPVDQAAAPVNSYVAGLLAARPPAARFAYYQLIDVQWPNSSAAPSANPVPQSAPLTVGTMNRPTVLNPVLETFMQAPNRSCVGCHRSATTATPPRGAAGPFAAGFSFLLMHAKPAS
jgi:hypothetical protein